VYAVCSTSAARPAAQRQRGGSGAAARAGSAARQAARTLAARGRARRKAAWRVARNARQALPRGGPIELYRQLRHSGDTAVAKAIQQI